MSGTSIAPALLLLPGIDGTGKFLREFAQALRPDVEPLIVPYPSDRALGYDELEALVLAALPADRPYALLGESFSGPVAIRIAARSPPRLLALVLCATFAGNPFPWAKWALPLAALMPLKALPRWVRAPLMWGSASPRRAPAQADRAIAGVSPAVIRRRIADGLPGARLAQIDGPHLLLQTQPAQCAAAVLEFMREASILQEPA